MCRANVFETNDQMQSSKSLPQVSMVSDVSGASGLSYHLNKWSLIQHTDKNGMTHLEVESQLSGPESVVPEAPKISDLKKGGPMSKLPPIFPVPQPPQPKAVSNNKKSTFTRELETILLSRELEGGGRKTKEQQPISDKIPRPKKVEQLQQRDHLNLSLRQRTPALLLQKLDTTFEGGKVTAGKQRSNTREEAEQLLWQKPTVSKLLIVLY